MADDKFNPLDPLGIFEGLGHPSPKLTESTSTRQADILKFVDDIRKQIPDESQANQEYTRLSKEAERLGFPWASQTLLAIAQDESRHKTELEKIRVTIW